VLAIVCRAENNRYYLRHGIECRAGYLGQWIEFVAVETQDGSLSVAEVLKKRHEAAMVNLAHLAEQDHLRQMDGINRDITKRTIDIKIKIKE